VTFSGDKLIGGPQAGLIVGRGDLIGRLRRDPLARAVRPDKVTLAALAATLELYRVGLAAAEIPIWRMIAATADSIRRRVDRLVGELADACVERVPVDATIGGGSLPGETLPSHALALVRPGADRVLAALRTGEPAVMGRVADRRVLLDLRTVDPAEDDRLAAAVAQVLARSRP
jgi:L-seryl-tRNA(Ser) seleniumtransferase